MLLLGILYAVALREQGVGHTNLFPTYFWSA